MADPPGLDPAAAHIWGNANPGLPIPSPPPPLPPPPESLDPPWPAELPEPPGLSQSSWDIDTRPPLPGWVRRHPGLLTLAGLAVLVLLVGLVVLDAWRGVSEAQSTLTLARADVSSVTDVRAQLLSAAGRRHAADELASVATLAQQATHDLTSSPGLSILGVLPYFHTQRTAAVELASDLAETANTGQSLLFSVDRLVSATHGTSISLTALKQLASTVGQAISAQRATIRPTSGLYPSLAAARHKLNHLESQVVSLLGQGHQLLNYAIPFLGGNGPRTYLLAAENNAEMRDQGAVLSYAVMTTDNGRYTIEGSDPIADAQLHQPAPVAVSPGTQAVFGGYLPTQLWQSVDATADFSWSGATMQSMFEQATGVQVNGVIGVDVPMLSRLLALTGPVAVPGIAVPVTAQNVSPLLLNALYRGEAPGNETEHHDQTAAVFRAVVDRLDHSHVDLARLAETLAKGVAGRDLLAWDAVPSYERTIAQFNGSGAIDTQNPDRTFHVAVENATASKLDYYVRVRVAQSVNLTAANNAVVNTTVTLINTAPAGQPPSYALGPDGISSAVPGQYVGHVYLWSPRGSSVEGGVSESGLVLLEHDVSVMPRQEATVTFQTVIPNAVRNGRLELDFVPQPRLQPEQVTAILTAPAWNVDSQPAAAALLTHRAALTWTVHYR